MIDEHHLDRLGDPRSVTTVARRPVGDVLSRGTKLRRRRHAMRSAGVGTIVVGVVGAGFLAVSRQSSTQGDEVAVRGSTSTTDVATSPPPPVPDCLDGDVTQADITKRTVLQPAEVPDELRLLPSYVPGDGPIRGGSGLRVQFECPGYVAPPAGAALALRADDAAGVVTAELTVSGPLPMSREQLDAFFVLEALAQELREKVDNATQDQVELRGTTALRTDWGPQAGVTYEWTEPDGWSWEVRGTGVDDTALRAAVEALVLDSSPEGDESPATLPAGVVPAGMTVAWQARGIPAAEPTDSVRWEANLGDCRVAAVRSIGDRPFESSSGVGNSFTTVNGHPARLVRGDRWSGGGTALSWEISPGVAVSVGCSTGSDDELVRMAESVAPVAADDPRLGG